MSVVRNISNLLHEFIHLVININKKYIKLSTSTLSLTSLSLPPYFPPSPLFPFLLFPFLSPTSLPPSYFPSSLPSPPLYPSLPPPPSPPYLLEQISTNQIIIYRPCLPTGRSSNTQHFLMTGYYGINKLGFRSICENNNS